ncbi:GCN5-related N-acetyltransferase [Terriglobus saanensis SP1PR4]|uniref:GCN5-related N-acetyltransferase n=2 Tax=Terriglobus saanensis TaxID=870903 RepID=E8V7S8_TERSS|nr:GCN5-related N-acetyltransferase [Terriglobus saanensis SP1PR4]
MIRRAVLGDIEAMRELATEAKEAPHWLEADYRALVEVGVSGVAEIEGVLAGFICGRVLLPGLEAELESIVVAKKYRRQGVGKALSDWLLHAIAAKEVRLEVRESNAAARSMYRAMGFEDVGLRRGYYSQPVEDAILMLRTDVSR